MNLGRDYPPRLIWLLGLIICLGGLWLVHQTPGAFVPPSPGQRAAPTQLGAEATPVPFRVVPLATATWLPTSASGRSEIAVRARRPVTLTIVYDNNPFDARLKTAWGFACLVETDGATLLFDTGGDGPTLMGNLAALAIDPTHIDRVVLSHSHGDHTGGLDALLDAGDQKIVYVPRSFPPDFKARLAGRAQVVEVSGPAAITDQIRTTGEIGTGIVEQSLIVETDSGLVVVTGCAHPGVVEIVRQAKRYGDVYLVLGGLHLKDKTTDEIKAVIEALRGLGVRRVAPCHCTGEQALQLFKSACGADFVSCGVGLTIRSADASRL
jgi:7,8-dihydropterin-6-yl-methyl-4-(beta-D-ribofuranosyl)aminobenzene 5'-phosphate synthase